MGKKLFNWEILILALIIIIAAIIRLVALFNFGTFCFDDMFSIHFSQMDLGEMLYYLKDEVHPPLYYIILHFWLKIFPANEISSRLPALIFSLTSIPLLYYLVKKLLNKWIAILSCLFFTFSYFQIFCATQVRMYSLLEMLGISSLLLFWLIFIEHKKKLSWLFLAVNLLMVFTHLGSVFALATQWLWLLILIWQKKIEKKEIKKFVFTQILTLFPFLLWLILLFLPKLPEIIQQGWYFKKDFKSSWVYGIYDFFFVMAKSYMFRIISGFLIFVSPFIVALWPDKEISSNKINPNWFLFSWILPAAFVSLISGVSYTRIFVAGYLGLYVILAYFFYLLYKNNEKIFIVAIAVWITLNFLNLKQNLNQNINRWDLTSQWIVENQKPQDKIITLLNYILPFEYYYTGNTPYEEFYPLEDSLNENQRLVRKNWQVMLDEKNINKLKESAAGFERIIIVGETYPNQSYKNTLINKWFAENGWQQESEFRPNTFLGPQAIIYNRND
jgi:uncharacterized membrane protein